MSEDAGPHSMIYVQVEPERIADINYFMEDYGNIAFVSTVDDTSGLLKFATTPQNYFNIMDIIENMPFKAEIVESFANEW